MNTFQKKLARNRWTMTVTTFIVMTILAVATGFTMHNPVINGDEHHTNTFTGVKANTGHAIHTTQGGRGLLTLSDDFVIPDAPAPHWQVVDSQGNVYLLQRLVVKGDKFNKTITVPSYVPDIARVQVWCAWAETLLGEASFAEPVK